MAPGLGDATERAALLDVVADPIRWRILARLGDEPRCVCAIQSDVDISASLLSYHLKVLREAGLISAARRGRWIDYTLAQGAHERIVAALPTAGG
jgi:ArsR family transcriptional regulator